MFDLIDLAILKSLQENSIAQLSSELHQSGPSVSERLVDYLRSFYLSTPIAVWK